MLIKTLTYEDYNQVERTEDFYFNLSKAEVTEMELKIPGGMAQYLKKIIAENDSTNIITIFKEIILTAHGVKSEDGKRFIKSKELSDAFSQTEAYSDLFMSLASNADEAAAFINGILPPLPKLEKTQPDKQNTHSG